MALWGSNFLQFILCQRENLFKSFSKIQFTRPDVNVASLNFIYPLPKIIDINQFNFYFSSLVVQRKQGRVFQVWYGEKITGYLATGESGVSKETDYVVLLR